MHPAWSIIFFTTLAGAAPGLMVALALASVAGLAVSAPFMSASLLLAIAMLLVGLGSSFLHLGRPSRAWRAMLMWRTSGMSREVIVLPAFIATIAGWWLVLRFDGASIWSAVVLLIAVLAGAGALWYCTAMIRWPGSWRCWCRRPA